jgi:hypothetical protein
MRGWSFRYGKYSVAAFVDLAKDDHKEADVSHVRHAFFDTGADDQLADLCADHGQNREESQQLLRTDQ